MRSIHQETQESTQRPIKSNQAGNHLDGFSETVRRQSEIPEVPK